MFRFSLRIFGRKHGRKTRFSSTTTTSTNPVPIAPTPVVEKVSKLDQWSKAFRIAYISVNNTQTTLISLLHTEKFWTILYSDYKDVAVDTLTGIKEKPRKAAAYFTGIGCVLFAMETNPEARTYYEAMIKAADDAILVFDSNLNPTTDKHLCLIRQSYNEGTVRCLNLGLFSLIWLGNYHQDCGIYPSQCKYLKPGIINFHKRIIDVGFLGQWWNIKWYMKDFDINPIEFAGQ